MTPPAGNAKSRTGGVFLPILSCRMAAKRIRAVSAILAFLLAVCLPGLRMDRPAVAAVRTAAIKPPVAALASAPAASAGIRTAGTPNRLYRTKPGDTFWGIARRHGLSPQALMEANPKYPPSRLPIGVELILPQAGRAAKPARPRLSWPISGHITSRYGWRWGRLHAGIDIAAPRGTLVKAAAAGRVTCAGWRPGYGLYVSVQHENGWRTAYAHNARLYVHSGQWVPAGHVLAAVGATGNATGNHLHFEVVLSGGRVDPLRVLP